MQHFDDGNYSMDQQHPMKAITPEMMTDWKDQMRRYKTVNILAEDFPAIIEIIEGRSHGGCFCPHCNPSK